MNPRGASLVSVLGLTAWALYIVGLSFWQWTLLMVGVALAAAVWSALVTAQTRYLERQYPERSYTPGGRCMYCGHRADPTPPNQGPSP